MKKYTLYLYMDKYYLFDDKHYLIHVVHDGIYAQPVLNNVYHYAIKDILEIYM